MTKYRGVHAEVFHDYRLKVLHVADCLVVDLAAMPLHDFFDLLVGPLLYFWVLGKAIKED